MQTSIPKLGIGFVLEPALIDEQSIDLGLVSMPSPQWWVACMQPSTYHAALVLLTACFPGSSDDVRRDDAAMGGGNSALFHFARHAFLDQVS